MGVALKCVEISGGAVVESASNPCAGYFLLTPTEAGAVLGQVTVETLATFGTSPESLTAAFLAGWGAVVGLWALAFAVGVAVDLVRQA